MNFDIPGFCSELIPGNKTKNTTKGRYSGGLAFYYKNNLKNCISIVKTDQTGILWIKVNEQLFPFDQDVYICHIYVPPTDSKVLTSSNIDLYDQLEQDIIKYNDQGKVFVSGDLNGRTATEKDFFDFDKYLDQNVLDTNSFDIPSRANQDIILDYNGRTLLDLCKSTGLLIANGRLFNDTDIGKFTFCSHRGQSTVDYLLLNFKDFENISYFDILEHNEHSDHAPISFNIRLIDQNLAETRENDDSDTEISRKIVWDADKIGDFQTLLCENQEYIQSMTSDVASTSVDDTVQSFTRFLHEKAFQIFGKTFCQTNNAHRRQSNKYWFNEDCKTAKHEFTNARNIFNRTKNDHTRLKFTRARTKYNRVKKKAQQHHRIVEGQRLNDLAKKNTRKFWKHIRKTCKSKHTSATSLNIEQLCDHFKNMFGEQTEQNSTDPTLNVNITDDELDCEITITELRSAVFSQNNNKAPGIDNISSEIIKASFEQTSPLLLNLYNKIFQTSTYPSSWGESIITPIFKKGVVNDAQNYRGITLINILAKIYSQLLLNRLTKWSEKNETITDNQFGFQKGKSTTDCVFILHSIISKVLSSKEKLYCVFIDFEKCFDKIDRSYLWLKLLSEHVSCKLVKAIKSMYSTVKLCIRYKNTFSEFFSSYIGLKQGDPSSPLLFMLFVNDILENINSNVDGIFTVNELKLFLILFADDQVVFAKTPDTLQSLLTDIEHYCTEWGLKINTSKTKAMIFEKGRRTYHEFFLYDTKIELVDSFKYLGITLFKNGSWYRSQKCIAQHASRALFNLFTIFNNAELSVPQKCKLFDTLVGSILNFGAELWGIHDAYDIELIHTKFLRRVLGVKKSTNLTALYGEIGRVPFSVYRKIIMVKYWIKVLGQSDLSLLKRIYLILQADTYANTHYNGMNWAYQIKNILQQHGLEYIWNQQHINEIPFEFIKQRILDMYNQKWYSDINNSSRLQSYSIFKHNFYAREILENIDGK